MVKGVRDTAVREHPSLPGAYARVHAANGVVCGMGSVLPDGHVLTCAHVVNAALGRPRRESRWPPTGAAEARPIQVAVSFPLYERADDRERRPATVVRFSYQDAPDVVDLAVLRPDRPLTAPRVPFAADGAVGDEFVVFGVPGHIDSGVWAEGTLSHPTELGRQLNTTAGVPLQQGFSGAPVWDRQREAVVGLLGYVVEGGGSAALKQLGVAVMTSIERVCAVWPDLRPFVAAGEASIVQRRVGIPQLAWADTDTFTGREAAVAKVMDRLTAQAGTGRVCISAIAGMGGVGKTALAVHVAHALAPRFPDGQLAVDLRGMDQDGGLTPHDALGRLLRQLVEWTSIPALPADRELQYQKLLQGSRTLVLLDNAAGEAQVERLLPASPSCGTLITSRRPMFALDNTEQLLLDVLQEDEAVELLGKLVGAPRVERSPEHAAEVVRLCGWLPLAIKLAGGMIQPFPRRGLDYLAAKLARDRREFIRYTDGGRSLEATFATSYRSLSSEQRVAFRLLSLTEESEVFGPHDLAALIGGDADAAERIMDQLTRAQLLDDAGMAPDGRPRYRFHDLIRVYAQDRLLAETTEHDRDQAQRRLLEVAVNTVASAHLVKNERAVLPLDNAAASPEQPP